MYHTFRLPVDSTGKSSVGFLLLHQTLGLVPDDFTQNLSPRRHLKSSLFGTKYLPHTIFIWLQLSASYIISSKILFINWWGTLPWIRLCTSGWTCWWWTPSYCWQPPALSWWWTSHTLTDCNENLSTYYCKLTWHGRVYKTDSQQDGWGEPHGGADYGGGCWHQPWSCQTYLNTLSAGHRCGQHFIVSFLDIYGAKKYHPGYLSHFYMIYSIYLYSIETKHNVEHLYLFTLDLLYMEIIFLPICWLSHNQKCNACLLVLSFQWVGCLYCFMRLLEVIL